MRMQMRRFTRLTNIFSKRLDQILAWCDVGRPKDRDDSTKKHTCNDQTDDD
jgi:hypothetical protein